MEPEVDIPVVHPPEYVIPGIHPEDPRSYGQIRVDMARDELTRHPVQATGSGPMADLQQPYRPTGGAAPGNMTSVKRVSGDLQSHSSWEIACISVLGNLGICRLPKAMYWLQEDLDFLEVS